MEIGATTLKHNWKVRLISIFLYGVPYATLLSLFELIGGEPFGAFWKFAVQGLLFGVLMTFTMSLAAKKSVNSASKKLTEEVAATLSTTDVIALEGPASLFKGAVAIGGRLFVTQTHIIFKGHKGNFQKGFTYIPLDTVASVSPRKTFKLIANGIDITTHMGEVFEFVVNDRDVWLKELQDRL
ncbi:GRAM domain-containing protein [Pustulibacterium marinum]|uniref:GRAM domain-containing protein n=1 Tax=Pustulibacterium marinum TaxID=1224947 RepID=A0A1I7GN71_9FLAO|nr:GRAM domain-containing protein [Pustulibacterium marinum]SFU49869.1 GRAM domain-containing protein [Pustulibacterium marinum]